MTDEETKNALNQIGGALSAQRFLLENLYALVLSGDADPVAASKDLAVEVLRQFNLPPTGDYHPSDQTYAVLQNGIDHMERFWSGVTERLQSAQKG